MKSGGQIKIVGREKKATSEYLPGHSDCYRKLAAVRQTLSLSLALSLSLSLSLSLFLFYAHTFLKIVLSVWLSILRSTAQII